MDNNGLKPCPLCGGSAMLENDGIKPTRSRDNGDLTTRWKVTCKNCSLAIPSVASEYYFGNDEILRISPYYDGRKKVIEKWNRRADHGKD